jgi:hypothetical protein
MASALRALAYHHDDRGEGHNWNSGAWSNKGTAQEIPIIFRNTIYTIDRDGGTLSFDWSWARTASKAASGTSATPAAPSATRLPWTARVT